jgi:hypothetical protein
MGAEIVRCLVLAAAAMAAASPAQQVVREPAIVREYLAALHRIERDDHSVKRLYEEAMKLRDQLMQRQGAEPTLLERLDAPAYQALERRLEDHGIVVNREEIVFVAIEPTFFLGLARRYGTTGDVEFFKLYLEMYPRGTGYVWPAYIEQQTDYSGCTSFASHQLVELYGRWRSYRSRFPREYQGKVSEAIQDIEWQLTEATCACEERQAVAAELKAFLAKFPDESIVPRVADRLRAIEDGRSTIRFRCRSG